jgi:hypothetical protein
VLDRQFAVTKAGKGRKRQDEIRLATSAQWSAWWGGECRLGKGTAPKLRQNYAETAPLQGYLTTPLSK